MEEKGEEEMEEEVEEDKTERKVNEYSETKLKIGYKFVRVYFNVEC